MIKSQHILTYLADKNLVLIKRLKSTLENSHAI